MRTNFINRKDSFFLKYLPIHITKRHIFKNSVDPIFNSGLPLKIKTLSTLLFLILINILTSSCNKDSDLLLDQVINKPEIVGVEEEVRTDPTKETIVLTADFQWENIEAKYANTNWEITEIIDLENKKVTIPQGVIMSFKGGLLKNGTLIGDETGIVTSSRQRLFDGVNLTGSFSNEFIKPFWFGAIMDGVTDDRDFFVETLKQATAIQAKLLVDQDIFLDVEETGKKSIFLEDNTWIEGVDGVNIIINNLLSPAFYIVLSENVVVQNLTLLYNQEYDATFGFDNSSNELNTIQLKNYLTNAKNINFVQSNPYWSGPISFRATFSIEASKKIQLENLTFKSSGTSPDSFIQWAIKFKEQYTSNQTISSGNESTDIPRDIILNNVSLDGVIMGFQGIVENFKSNGVKSYRYSDIQSSTGANIGGNKGDNQYWMPPPHLFYFNDDGSKNFKPQNIEIINTIDYGDYVGNSSVRSTSSGYCNSIKLTTRLENILVDNYKSYRRDGLGDLGGINNGVFKNIYSESNSSIFKLNDGFKSLRFVSPLNNCIFQNFVIKDNASIAQIYPIGTLIGDNITMDNVQVILNELRTDEYGCFGINGSDNKVVNSSVFMQKNSSNQKYRGIITVNNETMLNGKNNHYEIQVKGWKEIHEDPSGDCIRIILQSLDNPNYNYAKVLDIDNNFLTKQIKEIKNNIWTRKETVKLENGNEQTLQIYIPKDFVLKKASAKILENLSPNLNLKLSSDFIGSENYLSDISNANKFVEKTIEQSNANNSNHPLFLSANSDFNGKGKVEVTIVLEKSQIVQ